MGVREGELESLGQTNSTGHPTGCEDRITNWKMKSRCFHAIDAGRPSAWCFMGKRWKQDWKSHLTLDL